MPRITTPAVDAVIASRALTSAASFVPLPSESRTRSRVIGPKAWQSEGWNFYDTCGELRYAAAWFGNAISRARLRPARRKPDGTIEYITEGEAYDAATTMLGGVETQSQMLKGMGLHYFIAGEWYLIGRADPDNDDEDIFEVIGNDELKSSADGHYIDYGDGEKINLDDDDVVMRMWNAHPRRRNQPDSPVMAVLSTLNEIHILTRHIAAQVRSRLAGAGLLLLPNEVTFASPTGGSVTPDDFLKALAAVMAASIEDPGSPAALVPTMLKVPGEYIDKIRHLTFWSDLDQQAVAQRDAAIRRLALGLDLPPEVLLGTADVNHWGSWQIEESTIKAHIEPALEVISAGLTVQLRKVVDDSTVFMVADTSALRLRPNRSKEALELWDRGELNGEALRRETGFDSADSPKDDERKNFLIRKIASGSASPEQVDAALVLLGIHLNAKVPAEQQNDTRESRPDPSLEDHPVHEVPDEDDSEARAASAAGDVFHARLMATCDALCFRAMERVGNRLKNSTQSRPPGIETHDLYRYVKPKSNNYDLLLEGSWTVLPNLLAGLPFEPHRVEAALDAYAKALISGQEPHDRDRMMLHIDAALEKVPA